MKLQLIVNNEVVREHTGDNMTDPAFYPALVFLKYNNTVTDTGVFRYRAITSGHTTSSIEVDTSEPVVIALAFDNISWESYVYNVKIGTLIVEYGGN